MIADDSTPFGPAVVVGTVVVVVGTVVVVVGTVVVVVVVVVVALAADESEATLIGISITTEVNTSASVPASTRGSDSPRLFFTMPPRTCDALRRIVVSTMSEFEILGGILEGSK
jgi:hypothetical protein